MKHIFIVNTVAGERSCLEMVENAIANDKDIVDYEIYTPSSVQDSIHYIRTYLQNHPEEEVRFYACGGDGTVNKVATGIYGFPNASMTVLAYGSGNDYVKYYSSVETFRDIVKVMHGEEHRVDIMKVDDRYALNATHFGLDSVVAKMMNKIRRKKIIGGKNSYPVAVLWGFLTGMRNECTVYADGERLNTGKILLCTVANGKYVGGSYKCAPRSKNDDGLLEVCLIKPVSRFLLPGLMKYYTKGEHLDNPKFKKYLVYRRAKKVEIEAPEGFCISIDGEIYQNTHIVVENVERGVRFVAPFPVGNIYG